MTLSPPGLSMFQRRQPWHSGTLVPSDKQIAASSLLVRSGQGHGEATASSRSALNGDCTLADGYKLMNKLEPDARAFLGISAMGGNNIFSGE